MTPIDKITQAAQEVYYSLNGSRDTSTGADLEELQDNFILAANLFTDELDTEAYWNTLRENSYVLHTINNTTDFSFTLPSDYRTPIFNQYKEVKFVKDGSIITRFPLVDPSQVSPDDHWRRDRASFLGRKIILSRPPKDTEVTADVVLDVVKYFPKLTRDNADLLDVIPSRQLLILGVAKNQALASITKRALAPTFTQKYADELRKQVEENNNSTELYDAQSSDYGFVRGIW